MVDDKNYVNIQGWMLNQLHLKGNELIVYALIFGFSQTEGHYFNGTYKYIAEWIGGCEKTAFNVVASLEEKGLVAHRSVWADGKMHNMYVAIIPETNETVEEPKKTTRTPLTERVPKNDIEFVEKQYLENFQALYQRGRVATDKPCLNWAQTRKNLKDLLGTYDKYKICEVINKASKDEWVVGGGYMLSTILSRGVFGRLLNAKEKVVVGGVGVGSGVDEVNESFVF